jgi:hypothetical protein
VPHGQHADQGIGGRQIFRLLNLQHVRYEIAAGNIKRALSVRAMRSALNKDVEWAQGACLWVSMTPLGVPVVPELNGRQQISDDDVF